MSTIEQQGQSYSKMLDDISHAARQDRNWAAVFVARLCASGWTLWTDEELDALKKEA